MTDTIDLDPQSLSAKQRYDLLVGCVVPRPIAWVTTANGDGSVNLAPFSCFTYLCGTPPQILICMGARNGALKDTLQNILTTNEFVINSVSPDFVNEAAQSSAHFPRGKSEAVALNVKLAPSVEVRIPRVAGALMSLECRLAKLIPLEDADAHHLVIGQVVCFRLNEKIHKNGRVDIEKYLPVGRLGGPFYAPLAEILRADVNQNFANGDAEDASR